MNLILCWLVAPAMLLATCVGLSLLVERLAELSLPWAVRPALGIAIAIVLAQFGTASSATASLILPATIGLAVIGLVIGYRVPGRLPDRWECGVAFGVYLLFALPFLIHGDPTVAGYIKLDDSGTFMALSDHVFEYGRGVGHLPISTHEETIAANLSGAYPIGGFVPFALMAKLTGQDVVFTLQPSMAFAAGAMALLLFEAVRRVVRGASWAVAVAMLASLSSLFLGYYLWGGVKELVTAALLPLGPVLAGAAACEGWPRYAWVPLGIAIGAFVAVLGPGGGVWIFATLLPMLIFLIIDRDRRGLLQATPLAALGALLSLPVVFGPGGIFNPFQSGLRAETELGNLSAPLSILHSAGVWPAMDFRSDPRVHALTIAIAIAVFVIAAITVVACARLGGRESGRDGLPFAAIAGGGAVGSLAIIAIGSPWVDAKGMATVSPMILAAALLGLVLLGQRTAFRLESIALGGVLGAAVLWGSFLAYQGIWFAPEAHFRELQKVGRDFAGDGPALSTEVAIYGGRHFLRDLDDEGATDLRYRQIYLVGGVESQNSQYVDLDQIQTDQLEPYNLIVVRRGPFESRPPAFFELAYSGKYYEVWRRTSSSGSLLEHLPLGNSLDPGATGSCADVRRLSSEAGPSGRLVAARVDLPYTVSFERSKFPAGWSSPSPTQFSPTSSGQVSAQLGAPAGTYELWAGGDVRGGLDLSIDGDRVASERALIDNVGSLEPLGEVELGGGNHTFTFDYSKGGWQPGSGVNPFGVGPVTLAAPSVGDLGTVTVPSSQYRKLCDKRWDWIEAYG